MNKNLKAPVTTIDTTILSFPWSTYEEIKDLPSEDTKKIKFFEAFKGRALYTRMLEQLAKLPLKELHLPSGESIYTSEDTIPVKNFFLYFSEEVYGRFPGIEMTSASVLTFMAIIANESRSSYVSGSQSKNPEQSAAVPPILAAFKNQVPYSAWKINTKTAPFFLGKDLASAWIRKDQISAAGEELDKIMKENKLDMDGLMAIVTPSKYRSWDPKGVPSTYQKPKKGITATNYNSLEGFEKSLLLNLWMYKHDDPLMIVNLDDFDSRERMWRPFEHKDALEVETDGLFGMLKNIKNPHVSQELIDIFENPKLKKMSTSKPIDPFENDVPW